MILKVMMIIIAIKAISCGGGSSGDPGPDIDDDTNTNRVLTAGTNRNLRLNDRGAIIAIIALLFLLLLKHKCPENKSVVFSLPFVLWHQWGWKHFLMVIGAAASTTRHRILVGTHTGA